MVTKKVIFPQKGTHYNQKDKERKKGVDEKDERRKKIKKIYTKEKGKKVKQPTLPCPTR